MTARRGTPDATSHTAEQAYGVLCSVLQWAPLVEVPYRRNKSPSRIGMGVLGNLVYPTMHTTENNMQRQRRLLKLGQGIIHVWIPDETTIGLKKKTTNFEVFKPNIFSTDIGELYTGTDTVSWDALKPDEPVIMQRTAITNRQSHVVSTSTQFGATTELFPILEKVLRTITNMNNMRT